MIRPAAPPPRTTGRSRLAALFACTVSGTAGASPWLVEPSLTVGVEHQTNPEFRVADGPSSTQGFVAAALPAQWREGRYGAGLSIGGTFRQASGSASARDQSDFGLAASASRDAARGAVAVNASYSQTNLLGANAPDVGLDRSAGTERRYTAGARTDWRPSEYDTMAVDLQWSRRDYDAPPQSGLVGDDAGTVSLSYSRALRPNLQLLVAAGATEFQPDSMAPESRSVSLQAGLGWVPAPQWSLRATYGRSRVRFAGLSAPSDVYDVAVGRRTELGSLQFTASQSFEASPFGSIAKRRAYGASASRAISARLAATAAATRTESTERLFGLSLATRNTDEATVALSYALAEPWSLAGQLRYTRESFPATFLLLGRPAADSVYAGLSLQRRFGRVSIR